MKLGIPRLNSSRFCCIFASSAFCLLLCINYCWLQNLKSNRDSRPIIRDVRPAAFDRGSSTPEFKGSVDIRSRSNLPGVDQLHYIPRRSPSGSAPTIPHIIHQTWNTEDVPRVFSKWMVTWPRIHPDWEFWFWTQRDIRRLVEQDFKDDLSLFDSYTKDVFRSDAMRYYVLYKYGGVYLDLDMEALRPIDNITYGYNFVLSEETYEHPHIIR